MTDNKQRIMPRVMSLRHGTGLTLVLIALVIAVLQALATKYSWYFEYWWFDNIMHFLGGYFIGGSYLWLMRFENIPQLFKRLPLFVSVFVVVLAVGVAWEIYEYIFGVYMAANYASDTALDLTMDMVGMVAVYLTSRRL